MQKIWEKFRKISGTHVKPPRHAILKDGKRILDPKEISNQIGENLANVSSDDNLDEHFRTKKNNIEVITINFETIEDMYYNKKFNMSELEYAGGDNICFEIICQLAPLGKSYLLQFYNHLWLRNLLPPNLERILVMSIINDQFL